MQAKLLATIVFSLQYNYHSLWKCIIYCIVCICACVLGEVSQIIFWVLERAY